MLNIDILLNQLQYASFLMGQKVKNKKVNIFCFLNFQIYKKANFKNQMKKITFVEKDDNSSYDPVNTFFSKKKTQSVAKPSVNSSKQAVSSTKTPIEKSIQAKKQQQNLIQQAKQSAPQKIGQKGGSGYIPKKVPNFNLTSYQKLKQETIYDHKQKQPLENKRTFPDKANSSKKNFQVQKKPDMVFDVPKINYDEEFEDNEAIEQMNDNQLYRQEQQQSKNRLPQIKSPNTKTNSFQKPPVPKVQSTNKNIQKQKSSIKGQFSQKYTIDRQTQQKNDESENQEKQEPQTSKKLTQNSRNSKPSSSSTQKPTSSEQITNPPLNKQLSKQETQQPSSQNKQKTTNLQQRIKELQSYQKQYTSKIEYLEQRIQSLTKIEQKYNKLSKEHKLCQEKSKDLTQMSQQLAEAKQSIQKFMSQPSIPYSKKRQYLLLNQINQLKKENRQLVLRIKSYKGTDLMEMAISKNKEEIGREFEIDYHEEYNKLNTQMESQLSMLIGKVSEYLDIKSGKNRKTTKEEMTFDKEQRFLLEMNSIAEKMSLTYLEKYEVSPLPKCNQDCMNLYAQIQKEKSSIFKSLSIPQLMEKEDLNFAITETNLQIINDIQENAQQIQSLEAKILAQLKPEQKQKPTNRPSTSYGAQNKNTNKNMIKKVSFLLEIFKKRSSISTAFHIQSICYFTFLKQMIEKKLRKIEKELVNLYGRLKSMKDIFDLGGNTAKESLYLYLEANLQNFTLVVPNLQCEIKELRSSYSEISKGLNRAMQIKEV